MNLSAIFHRSCGNFCYPLNENEIEVNLKTGKDVKIVYLCYGDPFNYVEEGGVQRWKKEEAILMQKEYEDALHFSWRAEISPRFLRARYYFVVSDGEEELCFTEGGFFDSGKLDEKIEVASFFTFPYLNKIDVPSPPKWAEEAVWYQIFPTRFNRSFEKNNEDSFLPWPTFSRKVNNSERFGGNLRGIIEKIPYLKELGVTAIYLNPVNEAKSEHKYDTSDYFEIDKSLGDKEDMKKLVKAAHDCAIRVMMDGVFNHSGEEFFAWQDVLKNGKASRYKDWFMIKDFSFLDELQTGGSFSKSGKYYSFAFCDHMPKLNTNNEELQDYLLSALEMWIKEYDIDGIRLDVANEISHDFCKKLRLKARSLKADFFILGEIWHDSLPWLLGDEFDSVMNYPLLKTIVSFFCDSSMSARSLMYGINRCYSLYFRQINRVIFNQIDSHDVMRIKTKLSSKSKALLALSLIFFMPGSPCIYYGTEILLEGENDPDNRRCMPWKEIDEGKYRAETDFIKRLISLRKSEKKMRSDEFSFIFSESFPRLVLIKKGSDEASLYLAINGDSSPAYNDLLKNAQIILENGGVKNGVIDGNALAFFRVKNRRKSFFS